MVDLSKKIFIFNGYTFKNFRSLSVGAPEDRYKQSDKSIYGERRILYSPDPNIEITITVATGTEDEKILLNASENVITGSGYFKDSSIPKYSRGVTIKEIAVNKSELANDGESDSREFKLVCVGVSEVIN
ncbi:MULTISPECIES: hypothetical protein [Fusobacterium]|jgi:hypothetical protein|uniref:Uncharacterized protein n=2 Tax=Fusobacterium TaxID=848 RepID=A0A0X3Y258_FUSNC|nr:MULTISPECIES: hypothetical protein [Fusobacterium]DAO79225.1 MAG TPA: hypothetical protein [Caudoviricetes sp.]KUL98965.1 hypothetical protein RO03_05390 [Fusobacterium nucleatum subsp. nucleatum]PHI08338.1 hypothetical protein CBG52_09220 [Fusobacterium polymorphum]DAW71990.1 MAG TPA: hypothetical protein [Caudoviricetes sp.]DAY14658.1 MAG TPA: hypothetical protein [Caudoviricetes sp.]